MAGKHLQLRCKSHNGQHVLQGLTQEMTIDQLLQKIAEVLKMNKQHIRVRQGYPPKCLDVSNSAAAIATLGIKSGDMLIIEEDSTLTVPPKPPSPLLAGYAGNSGGVLLRKVVPADNSCLFTSINYVVMNGALDLHCAPAMRKLIAEAVSSDPETYTSAFLGKSNSVYCHWIKDSQTWGGAIEISILSKYYQIEICVLDTQSGRIDRFGEDHNYQLRVFLIYDGIHYDPLMMEPLDPSHPIQTVFPSADDHVMDQALQLASECKTSKQYTDVNHFTLKCLACDIKLRGQKEAQRHAVASGHTNFGEVN